MANCIKKMVEKTFPEKKVEVLDSEMSVKKKQQYFGKANEYWKKNDCVIYTPSCTVGISVDDEIFDQIFLYVCESSCGAQSIM